MGGSFVNGKVRKLNASVLLETITIIPCACKLTTVLSYVQVSTCLMTTIL